MARREWVCDICHKRIVKTAYSDHVALMNLDDAVIEHLEWHETHD